MSDAAGISTGQRLYRRAQQIIPGAVQLLGKRSEMYLPEQWPAYYAKAAGCEVWDLDGRRYVDCTMVGIGTSVLGYADPDVERAVISALRSAPMTTLNPPEEVELAELLLELHEWADMVTFARTGGEIMAKTARIVRAATGRDKIAFCGYHGWHDWYLAANLGGDALGGHLLGGLEPVGVPKGLAGTMIPFEYNDSDALEGVVREHGRGLAAIVMEPVRGEPPRPGFLPRVRALASQVGAVLVFDEITAGFRMNTGGVHRVYGVEPDVATYAKTMSNGFPMAAAVGRREVMDAVQRTFVSSAYWTERVGPAAAVATIRKHRALDVGRTLTEIGRQVQEGWAEAARAAGLEIRVSGIPPLATFAFEHPDGPALTTLFIQDLLDRGFLASDRLYAVLSHEGAPLDAYLAAVRESFEHIAEAVRSDSVRAQLRGPVKHTGFQRLA